MSSEQPRLFNVRGVAQQLSLGETKTKQLILSGEIESVTIDRRRLVPAEAIDAYVAKLRSGKTNGKAKRSTK